jgi:hypothetical protein
MSRIDLKKRRFLEGLLKISNFCTPLFKNVSPDDSHTYIQAGGGQTGIYWRYDVKKYDVNTIFYLNHPDHHFNEECFRKLESFKDKINADFGGPLEWNFKKGRRCQYIQSTCTLGGSEDEDKWPEIYGDLVERMVRLEKALNYYINRLP